jgi:hypothetical protein
MIIVSYLTRKPDYEGIAGLTFGTLRAEDRSETRSRWGTGELVLSLGLLACIAFAYLYFTG